MRNRSFPIYKNESFLHFWVPEPQRLAPTRDALALYKKGSNFQVADSKDALISDKTSGYPNGNGWERNENKLQIKWTTKRPAPDKVLEFVICNCKKADARRINAHVLPSI